MMARVPGMVGGLYLAWPCLGLIFPGSPGVILASQGVPEGSPRHSQGLSRQPRKPLEASPKAPEAFLE